MSRHIRRAPLVVLLLLVLPGQALSKEIPSVVNISQLAPGQHEIGQQIAEEKLAKWEAKAARRGLTLKKYAKKILAPDFAKMTMPVIVDPTGKVRNTDGHHRIWALRKLQKKTGVNFKVGITVTANYRGMPAAEYAKAAAKRLRIRENRVGDLPNSYKDMKNNPLRSLVGNAFKSTGVEPNHFSDFLEFEIGKRLLASGMIRKLVEKGLLEPNTKKLPKEAAKSKEIKNEIQRQIFTKGSPSLRYLLRSIRGPSLIRAARTHLTKAVQATARLKPLSTRLSKPQKAVLALKRVSRTGKRFSGRSFSRSRVPRVRAKPVSKRARAAPRRR